MKLLLDANLSPEVVQCLSTRFQVAQKIHAVIARFEDRENERFLDLIDLLLLREIGEDPLSLRDACIVTFEARGKTRLAAAAERAGLLGRALPCVGGGDAVSGCRCRRSSR